MSRHYGPHGRIDVQRVAEKAGRWCGVLVPRSGPRSLDPFSGSSRYSRPLPGAMGWPLGFGAAVLATVLAWGLGAGNRSLVGMVAVAAGAVGVVTTAWGALAAATQGWMFYTGFVRGRLGVLTLDALAARDLAIVAGVAVLASVTYTVMRHCASGRHGRPRGSDGRG